MSMHPEFVTFGETMISLVPEGLGPLRYCRSFRPTVAGAESNTAIGMARLGHSSSWVSRVGNDEMGHFVLNSIRAEGVDVRGVRTDPDHRTGLMFKERSAGETRVTYYRAGSAASMMSPADIDPELFGHAKIMHFSGITPVLSASCLEAVRAAVRVAIDGGARVSFDPNIRRKLWKDKDWVPELRDLAMQSDIVLLGLDEAEALFGVREAQAVAGALLGQGRITTVAVKDGANGAWVADKSGAWHVPPEPCTCIEPIGAGDGFNAGFLAGLLEGRELPVCGRMGNIAGALATQVPGDIEGYPDTAQMQARLGSAKEVYR